MCSSHPKKAETRMDKGLAADSEKEALYVHIRPPLGGRTKGVAATRLASPRVPPPPRAAPGVGHAAPGPLGCAPVRSRARAPAICRPKGRGCPGLFWMEIFKKRRRWGQLEGGQIEDLSTRKASVSSPDNSRTRRAVHTLVVWAGEVIQARKEQGLCTPYRRPLRR